MKEIQIFNKNAGYIKETTKGKIYISYRNRKQHFFRKYNGYGISTQILKKLTNEGIKEIIIIENREDETRRKLTTTPEEFYKNGTRYHYKQADYQIILPIRYWKGE